MRRFDLHRPALQLEPQFREERMLGYFVGFDFTGDALFEIDRFQRKEGRTIKPMTVREISDEEILGALAR